MALPAPGKSQFFRRGDLPVFPGDRVNRPALLLHFNAVRASPPAFDGVMDEAGPGILGYRLGAKKLILQAIRLGNHE